MTTPDVRLAVGGTAPPMTRLAADLGAMAADTTPGLEPLTVHRPAMEQRSLLPAAESLPASARLQILATEHWSLLATRSLTWNESFSRSNMFLATLSGTIVALALVAQATGFGSGFLAFALVVLPVVLFIGLATFGRLVAANCEDVTWVRGMNRLRHAYLELAPDIEPYLVAGWHDDEAGVMQTLGAPPTTRDWQHHVFVTTPAVVGVVDAAIAGTIAALGGLWFGLEPVPSLAFGITAFGVAFAILANHQHRAFETQRTHHTARFPTIPPRHTRQHA